MAKESMKAREVKRAKLVFRRPSLFLRLYLSVEIVYKYAYSR